MSVRYVPENIDPLEDELRSFRPAEPSRDLLERVGWQLASDRARPVWPWLAGAVAAAAFVVVATITWRASHSPGPNLVQVPTTVPAVAVVGLDNDDRPALATYRRAWARSPAELEELLDRHAARLLPAGGTDSARFTAASGSGFVN